ncbi:MAG: hypothetical protein H7Y06_00440 [Opitutaceae bacterium]|nr:hypothetical protein [Opitutaceae bacterium]
MNYTGKSCLLIGCLMSATLSSFANPVDRSAVTDNPAWALHLDADALRTSIVGKHILAEMSKPDAELRFALLKAATGSDLRTALHGITVYGATPSPEDGVALVYADLNAERLGALAKMTEDYRTSSHGKHQVLSWIDGKRREKEGGQPRTYAAIDQDRMVVVFAQNETRLTGALDVLDGTQPSLAKSAALPNFGGGEPMVIQGVARQFDGAGDNPGAAVLAQSKLIALEVRENGRQLLANLSLEIKDAESARHVANIARGIVGIIALQPDNPDAVKLARGVSVEQNGLTTIVKLNLPAEDVVAALKADAAKKEAKEAAEKKAKEKAAK